MKLYCRIYQWIFRLISKFLPWRKPHLLRGENCIVKLPKLIKTYNIKSVLIVTDKGILNAGIINSLLRSLEEENIKYAIYHDTVSNPSTLNVSEGFNIYNENNCQGIIGFGGGSSIDCAKGIGVKVAKPNKELSKFKAILNLRTKIPPIFAVPTTAGTGSEATAVAIISDAITHKKYVLCDMKLIPSVAVLDPLITINLPQNITSITGMDALTHAVEVYIGKSNTNETKELSKQSVKLIFENLYEVYENPTNIDARENMQYASYLAGISLTRAYVGYVHAIAHTLGGYYSIPHGLATAIVLPYILDYYGESVYKPLSELSDYIGICGESDTIKEKALKFTNEIKNLNDKMNIPHKIEKIKEEDIEVMVENSIKEANPLYPVPVILNRKELTQVFYMIKS